MNPQKTAASLLLLLGSLLLGNGLYMQAKAWLAQQLIQHAWGRVLEGQSRVRPWFWADTWPVARLRSEQHRIDLYVLSGASGATLAFGPGHYSGTALPGSEGTSVIAGHRDTHFRFLQHLQAGDQLSVETPQGGLSHYRVSHRRILNADQNTLAQDTEQSSIQLVTCYPFDAVSPGGPLRLVISATKLQTLATL